MNYKNLIPDLHMHTTVSDGTDTPTAIIGKVKEAGITVFSVTDHDAIKGCIEVADALTDSDPRFIPGVEFNCRDEKGRYHILGYGFDVSAASVTKIVEKGHALRMDKVRARIDMLKEQFGIALPADETEDLLRLDNPGKPHIANLMVRYGYADNKEQAIDEYLDKLHVRKEYIHPREVIEGIISAGGIPVLAHPPYGTGNDIIAGDELDARIRWLTGYGIAGVEAYYSGFTPRLIGEVLSLADKYDLYVSAGSDYHGTNKLVELGDTNLPAGCGIPARMEALFDRIKTLS